MRKDEMVGWHHRLSGHEFEQTQGDSEGQGSLACCSSQGCKEVDTTLELKNKSNTKDICMESRKLVQMNLFARQEQRHRLREQSYVHEVGRWEGEGWMN